MFKSYPTLDEIQLIAWHHMINDPFLKTYTVDERGRVYSEWVNPKLAWRRQLAEMTEAFQGIADAIQDRLFGGFVDLSKTMESFVSSIKQLTLNSLLPDEDRLD